MLKIFGWTLVLGIVIFPSSALAQLTLTCYRGTPNLDGKLDEWGGLDAAVLDIRNQIYRGIDTWTGPEDCSGKFYAMWDSSKVYIAAEVKDDKLVTEHPGTWIWMNDCVEVFFATTNERPVGNHSEHYQYGFAPSGPLGPEALKWNWCNMDGDGAREPGDYVEVKSSKTADGYVIEASVEYAQMKSLSFETSAVIGFHPCLDDEDGENPVDIDIRDIQMTWTGLEAHNQSTGFGSLILSAEKLSAAVSSGGKLVTTWSHTKSQ